MHRPGNRHRRPSALLSIGLLATACALAIAACGSSHKSGGAGGSNHDELLAYAKCVRVHGVPNFPDPTPSGAAPPAGSNTYLGFAIPANINLQSPAVHSALQTCRTLLGGGGPPGSVPESAKLNLLKHAECLRAHGVPNYPDPNIPSHGPIVSGPPAGVDTESPAFKRATSACGGP